jgi:hypothetical protein
MKVKTLSKFTCSVYSFVSPMVLETIKKHSINEYSIQQARSIVSVEKEGGIFPFGRGYIENMVDTYHFFSTPEEESDLFNNFVKDLDLNQEGKGSIYVEPVKIIDSIDENDLECEVCDLDLKTADSDVVGIYCIVQRGTGDIVAKAAIDAGAFVPSIFYGIGGGIRDRMGLIRITIPADKEMVNIVVSKHDCEGIMNILIDTGGLDKPGMGFIFSYPVSKAVMDTKSHIGSNKAPASIGQILRAIDEIKGNTEWRKRVLNQDKVKKRNFWENMDNLMLVCNDSKARDMLDVAMSAGATGATISKCRNIVFSGEKNEQTRTAIEISDMVISSDQKKPIVRALIRNGFFKDEINGKIVIRKSGKAFTYTG